MSTKYSQVIAIRVSPQIAMLTEAAALKRGTKTAQWLRDAIVSQLTLDGFTPQGFYTEQFARVVDGEIVNGPTGNPDERPGWLPIVEEYDPPLTSDRWTLPPPTYRVEADRIVRIYKTVPAESA